jgi:hypothetical protein
MDGPCAEPEETAKTSELQQSRTENLKNTAHIPQEISVSARPLRFQAFAGGVGQTGDLPRVGS